MNLYPETAAERQQAREVFDRHCDMQGIGYVTTEDEGGEPIYLLYDAKGHCLRVSRHGQFDLIQYAIMNGITIQRVH